MRSGNTQAVRPLSTGVSFATWLPFGMAASGPPWGNGFPLSPCLWLETTGHLFSHSLSTRNLNQMLAGHTPSRSSGRFHPSLVFLCSSEGFWRCRLCPQGHEASPCVCPISLLPSHDDLLLDSAPHPHPGSFSS